MIRASDIILAVRLRLHDSKEPYRWSDEALLDDINGALSAIVNDVNPWNDGEWIIKLVDTKGRYELPPYFHRLKMVKLNDVKLPKHNILGYEHFLETNHPHTIVSTSLNNFHIQPTSFAKEDKEKGIKSDILTIYFDRKEQIAYKEDEINLPDDFRVAIISYVMHLAHQAPVREGGDSKSMIHLNLYEGQIARIKSQLFANKHSRRIRSPHIRI